jgi:hypothetical protein
MLIDNHKEVLDVLKRARNPWRVDNRLVTLEAFGALAGRVITPCIAGERQ